MFSLDQVSKRDRKIGAHGRRVTIFSDLTYAMPMAATTVGILGQRNSGKTTLINLVVGADFPDSGTIRRDANLSFPVASGAILNRLLTVSETCSFLARIYGVNRSVLTDYVAELAGLEAWMKRKIADLDATSKVHLRFALSYAIPFDCYLADSALLAGDDVFQAKLAALVAERRRTSGFFFVTKSRRLIREFAHMAGVIEDNRIVMYPTPEAAIAAFDRMDQSADSEDIPSDEA